MRKPLLVAGLIIPLLVSAAEDEPKDTTLPQIKGTIRFHSDSYGIVPDDIELPANTLLEAKQRRVIEGDLGRLPIRIYVRETPNQPRPTLEVNVVHTRTNQPVAGYPAKQEVGPLGMLSFKIPVTSIEMDTLVRTTKKSVEGKLGKVDSVSLHIDVDIPVNPEKDADDDPILDCDELLNQDHYVVDDVSEKIHEGSTAGVRAIANAYVGCLDKQTDALIDQLKPDDKKTIERLRQLMPDLAPVSFDSAMNAQGGHYFSMLSGAGVSVDSVQAETLNRLAKQLGQSSITNPAARKAVSVAFASCQATLKQLVAAPENADDDAGAADAKKQFQSDLTKAKAALKELQDISVKLPDNSAMLLAQSSLAILEIPTRFE